MVCSTSPLLNHLCEAVGDGQSGVDEALHTAHQARLRPAVQLRAGAVYTLVPADVCEVVHLQPMDPASLIRMNTTLNKNEQHH